MGSLTTAARTIAATQRHVPWWALALAPGLAACGERELDVFSAEVVSAAPPPTQMTEPGPAEPGPAQPEPSDPGRADDGASDSPPMSTDAADSTAADAGPAPVLMPSGDIEIDNFEDGDLHGLATDGWWYVTNDGTSQQVLETVETPDRVGSEYALHSSGDGFRLWGAFIGLDLGSTEGFFDAGWTDAVSFWAKSSVEREAVARFLLQDNSSLETTFTLRAEWTRHVIDFDDFRFEGDPELRIDPTRLRHFQLYFDLDPFDVQLDDLRLLDL